MYKAIKYRIYPNKEQQELIIKTFGCVRYVYNYYLDKKIKLYEEDKTNLSFNKCSKDLTLLKKELVWLKEVDKFSLQNSLRNLDTAYKNFFDKRNKYPKFKSKKFSRKTYKTSYSNNNIVVDEKYIKLPKLGYIRYRDNTTIKGKIISVTISQTTTGKYFASVIYDKEIEKVDKTNSSIGIDLGLKDFCILSNGEKIENPHMYKNLEKKLIKEQKILSRRQEQALKHNKKLSECKNYQKQKIKVAKIHEKITNRRLDFLQKLTTDIAKNHDIICVEDLNVKGMVKNKHIAKSISDVSWSKFIEMLSYKSNWYGRDLIKVDRFYPSTKTCNVCGNKNNSLTLKDRSWECPHCHTIHDRDINAAINILNEGLKQTA